jgi:hypothetical protein
MTFLRWISETFSASQIEFVIVIFLFLNNSDYHYAQCYRTINMPLSHLGTRLVTMRTLLLHSTLAAVL